MQREPYHLVVEGSDGQVLFAGAEKWGALAAVRLAKCCASANPGTPLLTNVSLVLASALTPLTSGQQIDSVVYEQYKNQDKRTYLPVPFFISSNGYGLFLKTATAPTLTWLLRKREVASFAVESDALNVTLFAGEPKAVLSSFSRQVEQSRLAAEVGLWSVDVEQ